MIIKSMVLIKAKDRAGTLKRIYEIISDSGGNILFNFSYVEDGLSKIILVADLPEESQEYIKEKLDEVLADPDEDYDILRLAPESFDYLVDPLSISPEIANSLFKYLHPEERVLVLSKLDENVRKRIYKVLSLHILAEILAYAPIEIVREIASSITPSDLAFCLEHLDPDDLVDVVQSLDDSARKNVLKLLSKEKRKVIENLLKYKPDTAGGLMTTRVLMVSPETTVGTALEELISGKYEIWDEAYVVDADGRLIGLVTLSRLVKEDPSKPVIKVMRKDFVVVNSNADQKEVAEVLMKFDLTKVPVVDEKGRMLGVVTIDDIVDVIKEESLEETLAGLGKIVRGYIDNYLIAPILSLYKARAPWILALILVDFFTASIVASFEDKIAKYAILAAFLPIVIDSGGNIGSQAASLLLRSFSLGHITLKDVPKAIKKELLVGMLIGLSSFPIVLAISFLISTIADKSMHFATIVGISVASSMIVTLTLSSVIGALLVFIAYKAKIDPATMSAAMITTLVDITGSFIYFSISVGILEKLL
ncbi:MAG: magnesium transporter [Desulfurococcales archaeon]|nr:magnesium transporter [Fervidicoccaceae archaeon]NAZ11690.1 magnesium transporter [Desulfurococcales archaeon]